MILQIKNNQQDNLNKIITFKNKTNFLKKITNRLELKIIKNLNLNLRNKSKVKLHKIKLINKQKIYKMNLMKYL